MADDTPPTRQELLEAREKLERQLTLVDNPLRSTDQNPQLVARLQGMIDEIDEWLAAMTEAKPSEP